MATATLTVKLPDDFPKDALKRWGNGELAVEEVDMLRPALADTVIVLGDSLHSFGEAGEFDSNSIAETLADARRAIQVLEAVADITAYVERKDAERSEERGLRAVSA